MQIRDNPSFKGAYGLTMTQIRYFNKVKTPSFPVKVCKNIIITTPIVVYTTKEFYLLDSLNEKIDLFKSAGLIDFWLYRYISKENFEDNTTQHQRVLKLNQLVAAFYIWLSGCILSVTTFVIELIIHRVFKNQRK
jgi:hypothetical protein